MKLLKVFSISFFVCFSFLFATSIFAEESFVQNTDQFENVNFQDANIVSQNGNILNISFGLRNGKGLQSGLKYSIALNKETPKGLFTVDEYVYPDVVDLVAGSDIKKDIVYTAPSNLNGSFGVDLKITTADDMVFDVLTLGKIKLVSSVKTAEILPETCYLSVKGEKGSPKYSIFEGVVISADENLFLNCTAVNNSKNTISSLPIYETYSRTIYNKIASQEGGDITPIKFKPGEKKTISLVLPKATTPQSYDVKISLNDGSTSSNFVVARYVLHGLSATIQNLSLDKDLYYNKDLAQILLVWSSSADNIPGNRLGPSSPSNLSLSVSIKDDIQKDCIVPINQILGQIGNIKISAPVIANCKNPQISAEIKDTNGNVLDSKQLSLKSSTELVETSASSNYKNIIFIIIGILIVAGIAFYFINLKKKQNEKIN